MSERLRGSDTEFCFTDTEHLDGLKRAYEAQMRVRTECDELRVDTTRTRGRGGFQLTETPTEELDIQAPDPDIEQDQSDPRIQ